METRGRLETADGLANGGSYESLLGAREHGKNGAVRLVPSRASYKKFVKKGTIFADCGICKFTSMKGWSPDVNPQGGRNSDIAGSTRLGT